MAKERRILFISDLHLDESNPKITRTFCNLLKNCDESVQALYILGDLFEAWVGDDDESCMYQDITAALQGVRAKGITTYFMHGNRDFLVGKKFARRTGCELLAEETKIDLFGTPALLMHGDSLCTRDKIYLKKRKTARNRFYQKLFSLLPLKKRQQIGARMRVKSYEHTSVTPREIMDVTQAEVERVMRKHQVQYLIHGHTHRPAIHQFELNAKPAERIVLDAWHEHGNMLVWYASGDKELVNF